MCGIVGYTGYRDATQVLLDGLLTLEYRGYDSAGIVVQHNTSLSLVKTKGTVGDLIEKQKTQDMQGTCGIGHTRWATHGVPSDQNSHPHCDCSGNFALIHNGIIENYTSLKADLIQRGHDFKSETDTEVIVHMIEEQYDGDLLSTVRKVVAQLQGAYALAIVAAQEPDRIVVVRQETPLLIGLGEGEHILASDPAAIVTYTKKMWRLENGEMGVLTPHYAEVYDIASGKKIDKKVVEITWDITQAKKSGYAHFMRKEIGEQPDVIESTLLGRLTDHSTINLPEIDFCREQLLGAERLYIVACGTSYLAGLVGKQLIESMAGIPVDVVLASEFRYGNPLIGPKNVVIAISQSGETLDTLAAMRLAKEKGVPLLALVNVVGSSIATEANDVMYLHAGPEIGVASTKAYVSQLVALTLLAMFLAQQRDKDILELTALQQDLRGLSYQVKDLLKQEDSIAKVASSLVDKDHAFFIGRQLDYAVAMEGALKLKEISYLHAEAYAAGELKHGPLALVTEGVPVIALVTQKHVLEKTLSNVVEVQARGGHIILVTDRPQACYLEVEPIAVVTIPKVNALLTPILSIVPLQLLAYHVAVQRGNNPDQPRNLAKSVTVE